MNYIKKYKEFSINEELSPSEKRSLRFIPQAIFGFLGKKLLGIFPMLNLKWREMKRSTTGLKDTLFSTGDTRLIEHELIKMTIDDLPKNSLKLSMLLRDWNVYLAKDYKSKGGREYGDIYRDVFYISKDEIKKGDTCRSQRLNDSDIYPQESFIMKKNSKGKLYPAKLKDPSSFPMVIISAKYDQLEKVKEVEHYISDICLEIEDELSVEVKPLFKLEGDHLNLNIKISDNQSIKYSDKIDHLLTEVSERVKDYLKLQNYNFDYIIKYGVKGPFYYSGDADRFGKEIIPEAKEYSRRFDSDTDNPIWNRYYKTLDVSRLSMGYDSNDKLFLTGSDLRTLLSDLDNCTKSDRNLHNRSIIADERNKISEIELKGVSIVFKK